jgi:hypothetical protein
VRRLAIADQPRDVAHGDRRLLAQQLRRCRHAPGEQILGEAEVAELRVRTLHLARRAADGAGDDSERQRAPVVARDDHACEQIQPSPALDRLRVHIPPLRPRSMRGTLPAPSGLAPRHSAR